MNQFPKSEHLRGEKTIENLFKNGKVFIAYPFRVVYLNVNHPDEKIPVRTMVSVSKKKFKKAVNRNRIKRLMRETYRLNKAELIAFSTDKSLKLHVAFQYIADEILCFDEVNNKMQKALEKLKKTISDVQTITDENS